MNRSRIKTNITANMKVSGPKFLIIIKLKVFSRRLWLNHPIKNCSKLHTLGSLDL